MQIRNNQRQTISILNISRLYHVGLSAFDECVWKLAPLHNIMYTCLNSQKINDTTSGLRDEFELFLLNTRNYKKCRTQVVALKDTGFFQQFNLLSFRRNFYNWNNRCTYLTPELQQLQLRLALFKLRDYFWQYYNQNIVFILNYQEIASFFSRWTH